MIVIDNDSSELELDLLDVEEFAGKSTERKPRAKSYVIRVDKTKYTVREPTMTGRDILILVGKEPPEQFRLKQKFHGGEVQTIDLHEVVDFRAPGVERFMTLKLENTEG